MSEAHLSKEFCLLNARHFNLKYALLKREGEACHVLDYRSFEPKALSRKDWFKNFQEIFVSNFDKKIFEAPVGILLPENVLINVTLKCPKSRGRFSERQAVGRWIEKNFGLSLTEVIYRFKKMGECETSFIYWAVLMPKKCWKRFFDFLSSRASQFPLGVHCLPALIGHAAFAQSLFKARHVKTGMLIFLEKGLSRFFFTSPSGISFRQTNFDFIDLHKSSPQGVESGWGAKEASRELKLTSSYFTQILNLPSDFDEVVICAGNEVTEIDSTFFTFDKKVEVCELKEVPHLSNATNANIALGEKALFRGIASAFGKSTFSDFYFYHEHPLRKFTRLSSVFKNAKFAFAILSVLLVMDGVGWVKRNQMLQELEGLQTHRKMQAEVEKNIFQKQASIKVLRELSDRKQAWASLFEKLQELSHDFEHSIWLDRLEIVKDNGYTVEVEGAGPPAETLIGPKRMLIMQGRLLEASLSVQKLKERFVGYLGKLGQHNFKTPDAMNAEMKPKKQSSDAKEFVCSLLLDPESYL